MQALHPVLEDMRMRSMLPAQYTSYSYVTKRYVSQHQLERTGIRSLGRSSLLPAPPAL